jgi:hypothetical protein
MAASNPYTAMFDVQKTMIESSWKAVEGAATVQRNVVKATLDSADATKEAQLKSVDFSKRAVEAYFESLEDVLPAEAVDELRTVVDEQYDALEDAHDEAWVSFEESLEESLDAYDELSESQLAAIEDAFDALLEVTDDAADAAADIEVVAPSEE